jgi:general secretion pathway protein L
MSDALVIRLGKTADVQYLLVDAAGGRLGSVLSGPLSQAAPLAANRRVIVLIPGTEVISAEPQLPAKSATRLLQLAPYALEEQLATDIDAMHFAVGKREASGKTPVAAVQRVNIEQWFKSLSDSGIQADAIYSESSLIPNGAGTTNGTTLIVDRGLVYVRRATSPGLVLDVQPIEEAFQLLLGGQAEGGQSEGEQSEQVLGDLQLYATQDDYEQNPNVFETLRGSVPGLQIKLLPEGPLPLFALQAVGDEPVNFLCGPYARKSSIAASLAPWRYAAVLLGIAAFFHFTYNGIQLWTTSRAEREVDKQIRELVAQTVPGMNLNDTRDARKQFEARLGMLKQSGGQGNLIGTLTTLRDALAEAPDTRVEAILYRMQTLDLRLTAPSIDALDKITQAASASGFAASLKSTTSRDNKYEGQLQLKPGA